MAFDRRRAFDRSGVACERHATLTNSRFRTFKGIVARCSIDGPLGIDRFKTIENFLDVTIPHRLFRRVICRMTEPLQISQGIHQAVDVIDAKAVDDRFPREVQNQSVTAIEDPSSSARIAIRSLTSKNLR